MRVQGEIAPETTAKEWDPRQQEVHAAADIHRPCELALHHHTEQADSGLLDRTVRSHRLAQQQADQVGVRHNLPLDCKLAEGQHRGLVAADYTRRHKAAGQEVAAHNPAGAAHRPAFHTAAAEPEGNQMNNVKYRKFTSHFCEDRRFFES